MMHNVCIVTSTRAEYGLLRPLIFKVKNEHDLNLQLVVSGTHLSEKFGNTQNEIIADGFYNFFTVELPLDDDSKKGMAIATGTATQKFAKLFSEISPNIVVVLGDRYEMLGVAIAAHMMGIPLAHMCGGDVTEGAVDDAIRHCITKLSYLHFPGCEQSAKRIIQMGEEPDRVFNVGEPGIENCLNIKLLSREELSKQIGFEGIKSNYSVVTFHPATMENNTAEKQVRALINAMDVYNDMSFVITKANADSGGRIINEIWDEEAKHRDNWLVVNSLGMLRYLSAVKYASMVIGNSSSGLVEVPALGVPTINIGDRQKGRMMADSVISCDAETDAIVNAIKIGLSSEFVKRIKNITLPFGNGNTSEQVIRIISDFLKKTDLIIEKKFYDMAN